jgi:hypothetical protein
LDQPQNFKRKERLTLSFPKNPFDPLPALEFFLSIPRKSAVNTVLYFNLDSSETVSFLRPFLRRLANTLRPLAVCIRSRKP